MLRELKTLLDSLHSIFAKHPLPSPALRISFDRESAAVFLTLDGHTLSIIFAESSKDNPLDSVLRDWGDVITSRVGNQLSIVRGAHLLTYDLRDWTLERLAEDISSHQGFAATVLRPAYNKILASALLDGVTSHDLMAPVTLDIATSPLWTFFKPIAFALGDAGQNIDIALEQLNIFTSKTYFADYWGSKVGIPRKSAETDIVYTQRIVDTILLQRANNLALEQIIENEFGVEVTIVDTLPLVLDINNSIVHSRIAGEVYNTGNFIVTGPTTLAIHAAIERHKAAGTKAFYIQMVDALLTEEDQAVSELFEVSIFDAVYKDYEFRITSAAGNDVALGDTGLPPWTVGVTPMAGSVIG